MVLSDVFLFFFIGLVLLICVLVGVAFLTLMERKILGYIQIRKGPNKVGLMGIPQPFSDAIKLFSKEQVFPLMSNFNLYYLSPVFNLFFSLLLWMCLPLISGLSMFSFSVLFFLCCSSLGVYSIMISGWASNSNYALLGCIRSVAQAISYEVSMFLILLSFLYLVMSLKLSEFKCYQDLIWFLLLCLPLSLMLFVSSLAETNRTPFDFAEGESELVSGFNVEYSGGGFALIFLAEYSNILFMSVVCVIIFMGGVVNGLSVMKMVFIAGVWIWVRGSLPRYRYDKLMYLCWKSYLPISLNYLFMFFSLSLFILILMI